MARYGDQLAGGMVNEEDMARAVTQGLHQYEADRRAADAAAERRWARKTALVLFGCAVVVGLVVLGSFGKL